MIRFGYTVLVILLLNVMTSTAQAPVSVEIYVETDSLTVFVPDVGVISLEGFGFQVQIGQNTYTYRLEDYGTFGMPFESVFTPTCFRLVLRGSNSISPQACVNVTTFIQPLTTADVFWYDPVGNAARTLQVIQDASRLAVCPAGNPICTINFTVQAAPPTPSPTPSLGLDPYISYEGMNADWTPIIRQMDGIDMTLVPAGCFSMGSADLPDAQPNRQCFDLPYWINVTEVTNAQYSECVDDAACTPPRDPYNWANADFAQHPIVNVDWFQAQTYCEWQNGRLPNEREWEYAARGVDSWEYPWGMDFDGERVNMLGATDTYAQTAPAGTFPDGASWVGALDMAGNVWEWVYSMYNPYPYNLGDGREADTGDDLSIHRVMRGGAWGNDHPVYMRTSGRNRLFPNQIVIGVGFRCVRDF